MTNSALIQYALAHLRQVLYTIKVMGLERDVGLAILRSEIHHLQKALERNISNLN